MRFLILGPLEAYGPDGHAVRLGAPKQRVLLSMLLLHANRLVLADRLVDALWPVAAPPSARRVLRTYVSALRSALSLDGSADQPALLAAPGGYRLRLPADELDVLVFERLADDGERALAEGDLPLAAERLHGALALWRGPVLADLVPETGALPVIAGLDERRLAVQEAWLETRLALGEHGSLIGELRTRLAQDPLRERLAGLLMVALHRSGRRADALAVYAETRRQLTEELGIEPGTDLQRRHRDILGGRDAGPDPQPPAHAPRQLPAAVRQFTGRHGELAELTDLLGETDTVVITAIDGMAGIGKTTMAVHWAHRVADRFPDGQLYVNLRGFDASGSVMAPDEALRYLLDALGVPAEQAPTGLDALAARYRSLLAGRRILVVLDNARDAAQVRPLLPGSPGCLAVVTSRRRLGDLVAGENARLLSLDLLAPDEARELLANRLGGRRVAAEPAAVDEIISHCARLPLALAVVAARAAARPAFALAVLAEELRSAPAGLDGFASAELDRDLRAVFSWSYRQLSPGAADVFRLLGLHPGAQVGGAVVASMAGLPLPAIRPALAELVAVHLVTEPAPGRYALHDLLRAYAVELCGDPDERTAALHRMVEHYLHTARAGMFRMDPFTSSLPVRPPGPGVVPQEISDAAQAIAWFSIERPALLAAVPLAAEAGLDELAWHAARNVVNYLLLQGSWPDLIATAQVALAAARRLGDRRLESNMLRALAFAYVRMGRHDEAEEHVGRAIGLDPPDDPVEQARSHYTRSLIREWRGDYAAALPDIQRALTLYLAVGDPVWVARSRADTGWLHAKLDQYQPALAHLEQALAEMRELGDRKGEAHVLDSIGYGHHQLGRHALAIECYGQAVERFRTMGDRHSEADSLLHLGEVHASAGEPGAAGDAWRHALEILRDTGSPDVAEVEAKLKALADHPAASPS
jgi:DNA-binding SARP family transcriptional activator